MKNILLSFLIMLTFGCSNEPNYTKIGAELCECMQPMVEVTNKITELAADSENETAVQKLVEQLEALNVKTEECVDNLSKKYPNLENEDPKAKTAFKENCPDVAAFLEG